MSNQQCKPPLLHPDSTENILGVQPVSSSDDDLSSPECLLSLQPVGDEYSSDDEARTKMKKNNNEANPKKKTSNLSETFIANSIRPSYSPHVPGFDFTRADNPTLAQCLQELLDFALEENQERRMLIDGKILFDGKTADKIIEYWSLACPKVKWLREHFSHDISHDIASGGFELLIKDITDGAAKPKTLNTIEERNAQKHCLNFVGHFLELFKIAEEYDANIIKWSCPDELQDVFKQVVPTIAALLEIPLKSGGECRLQMEVSEVCEYKCGPRRAERVITARPDYILMDASYGRTLCVPVQVHAQIASSNENGDFDNEYNSRNDVSDVENSQNNTNTCKLTVQHIVQHVALLGKKMAELQDNGPMDRDRPRTSVGMFLTRGKVHLTKVTTTVGHLTSFNTALLPRSLLYEGETTNRVTRLMMDRVRENGLMVTRSKWHVDLCKGLHRNALFLFLLQYIWGHEDCIVCQ